MSDPATESARPPLDAAEARILAALVEKEATTPESYPLTANAVQLACNQKTHRDPVLELEAGAVGHALRQLEQSGLVRSVHGARAQRYEHRFAQGYSITLKQQALLCVLMLRGPQTLAELLARCERLQAPEDLEDARQTLERLQQRGLAQRLARQPGQREDRYVHLLCGPVDESALPPPAASASSRATVRGDEALERRVADLEARIARLEAALDMPVRGADDAD